MRRGSQGVESVHRSRQGAGRIVSLSVLFALIDGALGMCSQFQTGKLHRVTTALTHPHTYNRRHAVSGGLGVATAVAFGMLPFEARAGDEEYKDLSTKLSSKLLTSAETAAESRDALGDINWGAPKVTGLSTEEMAKRSMPACAVSAGCHGTLAASCSPTLLLRPRCADRHRGIQPRRAGFYKQGTAVGEIVCWRPPLSTPSPSCGATTVPSTSAWLRPCALPRHHHAEDVGERRWPHRQAGGRVRGEQRRPDQVQPLQGEPSRRAPD